MATLSHTRQRSPAANEDGAGALHARAPRCRRGGRPSHHSSRHATAPLPLLATGLGLLRLAAAFTVCVVHDPPFTICPSATFQGFVTADNQVSGFDVEMLRWALTDLNYTFDAAAGYADPQYKKYAWRCGPEINWKQVEVTTYTNALSSGPWPATSVPPASAAVSSGSAPYPYPCDIGVGDFVGTSTLNKLGSIFVPYYSTGSAILTHADVVTVDPWAFFKPFHWSLWAGFISFAFIVPAAVFFVERLSVDGVLPLNMEGLHQWRMAQYSTLLAIFNLEVYDVMSLAAQINIIAFCFMILIVVQTYNAQLGALYVNSQLAASVQSMEDLRETSVGVYGPYAGVMQLRYPNVQLVGFNADNSDKLFAQAIAALDDGSITAFVHDVETFIPRVAALPNPCKYKIVLRPFVQPFSYAFIMSSGWNRTKVVSDFVPSVTRSQQVAFTDIKLQAKYLATLPTCAVSASVVQQDGITFQQLSGLFLIVGVVTGFTLLFGICNMIYRVHLAIREDNEEARLADQSTGGASAKRSIGGGASRKSFSKALSRVFVKQTVAADRSVAGGSRSVGAASMKSATSGYFQDDAGAAPPLKDPSAQPARR